jgi:anti-anti-sigma regulatory factor
MTRKHGVLTSAAGMIPFGHLGWGYRDRGEFVERAAEYIADGLDQNQWVEYVGARSPEQLRAELAAMPGLVERADAGDIKVTPSVEFYGVPPGTDVVDPQTAVATRCEAVEKAIADGYMGFRVVSDVTALARAPVQRAAFARYEFLIDQKMAVLPCSALCAYDLDKLGPDAAGLICLHPFVGHDAPPFRLYAEPGTGFVLTGELDAASDELFTTTLQRMWPLSADDPFIVDAQNLGFIGHRQLLTFEECARSGGRNIVLRSDQAYLARLVDLLELDHVCVKPAGTAAMGRG